MRTYYLFTGPPWSHATPRTSKCVQERYTTKLGGLPPRASVRTILLCSSRRGAAIDARSAAWPTPAGRYAKRHAEPRLRAGALLTSGYSRPAARQLSTHHQHPSRRCPHLHRPRRLAAGTAIAGSPMPLPTHITAYAPSASDAARRRCTHPPQFPHPGPAPP